MATKPPFWLLTEDQVLSMLRRVAAGEEPDAVYAELYANSAQLGEGDIDASGR